MAALSGRSAAVLGAVMAAAVLLVTALYAFFAADIRANQQAYATQQLRSLQQELAANATLPDPVLLTVHLQTSHLREIYPLYEQQRLAAVLVLAEALDGYNGSIHLLLAVAHPGQAQRSAPPRLRVLRHRETPGLADFLNRRPEAAYDGVSGASISAAALTHSAAALEQWLARCLHWQARPGQPLLAATCRTAE